MSDSLQNFTVQRTTLTPPTGFSTIATVAPGPNKYQDTVQVPQSGFWYRLLQTTLYGATIPYVDRFASAVVAGNVNYAKQTGSTGNDTSFGCAAASNGDIIVVGYFAGTVDFDPAHQVHSPSSILTAISPADMFIARYDSSGNYIRVVQFGVATGSTFPAKVAIDSSGSIIVYGKFTGTANVGGANITASTPTGVGYLSKYNSAGVFAWRIIVGPNINAGAQTASGEINLDSQNNILISGTFANQQDWNLTGTDSASVAMHSTFATPSACSFVAKISPAGLTVGLGLWSFVPGTGGRCDGKSVVVDSSDNVFLIGTFNGFSNFHDNTVNPDSPGYHANNELQSFIAKYTPAGAYVWSQAYGLPDPVSGADPGTQAIVACLGANDNIIMWGKAIFRLSIGGPVVNVSAPYPGNDGFFAEFSNVDGSWVRQTVITGTGHQTPLRIIRDPLLGNYYASGTWDKMVFFGGNVAGDAFFNAKGHIWKLDSALAPKWQVSLLPPADAGDAYPHGIALSSSVKLWVSGYFHGQITVQGTVLNTSISTYDIFRIGIDT